MSAFRRSQAVSAVGEQVALNNPGVVAQLSIFTLTKALLALWVLLLLVPSLLPFSFAQPTFHWTLPVGIIVAIFAVSALERGVQYLMASAVLEGAPTSLAKGVLEALPRLPVLFVHEIGRLIITLAYWIPPFENMLIPSIMNKRLTLREAYQEYELLGRSAASETLLHELSSSFRVNFGVMYLLAGHVLILVAVSSGDPIPFLVGPVFILIGAWVTTLFATGNAAATSALYRYATTNDAIGPFSAEVLEGKAVVRAKRESLTLTKALPIIALPFALGLIGQGLRDGTSVHLYSGILLLTAIAIGAVLMLRKR